MKKLKLAAFILMAICLYPFIIKAQQYKVIFKADSLGQLPDSVKVINLYEKDSLMISGIDTLYLVQKLTSLRDFNSNNLELAVYPNPVIHSATVSFTIPQPGDVKITAYNLNGQVLITKNYHFKMGRNFFELSGFIAGTFILTVETEFGNNSKIVMSTNHDKSTPKISFTRYSSGNDFLMQEQQNTGELKSKILEPLNKELKYNSGDTIHLIAYLDDETALIEISPKEDTVIIFEDFRNKNGYALEEIEYQVILPDNTETPPAKIYTITNAYGSYELKSTSANKSSSVKNELYESYDYSGFTEINRNGGYQLNYLTDNDGNHIMCGLATNSSGNGQFIMDAKSTAISMLMTHPLLISSFAENYENITSTLETLDSFDEYVTDVSNMIKQKLTQSIDLDYTDVPSYNKVVIELINTTFENINLTLAHGKLLFDLQERSNGVLKYTITNFHKRTVHLYPKKVWVDAGGFAVKEEAFLDYGVLPVIDIIEPDGLNFWKSAFGIFKNDFDTYKKTSEPMEVDLEDADKLKVEIYGLGKLHKDFDELTDEELLKMVIVAIHGGYVDFVRPTIDLILGAKELESSGTSSQHFDFRYGSRKYPEVELIRLLAKNFFTDIGEMNTFRRNLEELDFTGIMYQFGKYSIDQILGDKQSETEKVRYLNLIYNTGKKWTGVSSTSDGFRKAIKQGSNQISAMKNANFAGTTIKLGSLAVDVANAVYAYNDSYFREDFFVNKTAEMMVTLTSPENDFTLENDTLTIEFTWVFDRGNHIGTYSFELIINETLEGGSSVEHKYNTGTDRYYSINLSDFNPTSKVFTWKVKVLNANGTNLIESESRNLKIDGDNIQYDSFTDSRDGHVYKTIKIGDQIWMAENLAFLPEVSPASSKSFTAPYYYVYDYNGTSVTEAKATDNYKVYGVLYNWPAAKVACPLGWHLPDDDEWKQLEIVLGMTQAQVDAESLRGTYQGNQMKSTSGWYNNGNGSNTFGFSALPGGYRQGNTFGDIYRHGYWWSSTEKNADFAWFRYILYYNNKVGRSYDTKWVGISIRCVKD